MLFQNFCFCRGQCYFKIGTAYLDRICGGDDRSRNGWRGDIDLVCIAAYLPGCFGIEYQFCRAVVAGQICKRADHCSVCIAGYTAPAAVAARISCKCKSCRKRIGYVNVVRFIFSGIDDRNFVIKYFIKCQRSFRSVYIDAETASFDDYVGSVAVV